MFRLFEAEDENKFTWESIGDVIDGRKNLGEGMPVYVYRLFQFTIKDELVKRFGKEVVIDIFRNAGELAGREFANHLLNLELPFNEFIAHLQGVLEESKIGILRITGETVCNYDEGFLAGILKVYTKKEYVVTEVDCWATGSRVCRFEASVKNLG